MIRVCSLLLVIALVSPVAGADDALVDAHLRRVIQAFDLRPLPTKAFEETDKYKLGRALFFDPILSGNRDVSCATCHLLSRGTTDALAASIGTGAIGLAEDRALPPTERPQTLQPRNALDLWNRDNNRVRAMFWDGRVEVLDPVARRFRSPLGDRLPEGLENLMAVQALFPLAREDEMLGLAGDSAPPHLPVPHGGAPNDIAATVVVLTGAARINMVHQLVMQRILGAPGTSEEDWHFEYQRLFRAAYPQVRPHEFSIVELANALSHFEEIAFATRNVPWDAYLAGDTSAIGEEAKRGALLFYGKGRCVVCHDGPLFSDFEFHAIGVKNHGPGFDGAGDDQGRYRVTGLSADLYRFRTPPLRNVTLTAPYFHNGTAETLEEAVIQHLDPFRLADQYEESGATTMSPAQIEAISPILETKLALSSYEVDALMAFLRTLEDTGSAYRSKIIPQSVPSGLPVSSLHHGLVQ